MEFDNKRCHKCGGEMKEVKFDHEYTAYGPKPITLLGIPGEKCFGCGNERVSVTTLNIGVDFLRKIEKGLIKAKEVDGIIVAKFPED